MNKTQIAVTVLAGLIIVPVLMLARSEIEKDRTWSDERADISANVYNSLVESPRGFFNVEPSKAEKIADCITDDVIEILENSDCPLPNGRVDPVKVAFKCVMNNPISKASYEVTVRNCLKSGGTDK